MVSESLSSDKVKPIILQSLCIVWWISSAEAVRANFKCTRIKVQNKAKTLPRNMKQQARHFWFKIQDKTECHVPSL